MSLHWMLCLLESLQLPISWVEVFVTENEVQVLGSCQHDRSTEQDALQLHIHEVLVKCGFYTALCDTRDLLLVLAVNVAVENSVNLTTILDYCWQCGLTISNFRVMSLFLTF